MKTINFIEAIRAKRISGVYKVKLETDVDRLPGKIFHCGTDFSRVT
jgi:hypothetical protein